jgi:hypothetical protein
MTHRSPLLTLAAVAAFFAAMLIANFIVNPGPEAVSVPAPATTSAPSTQASSPSPRPASPTPSATPNATATASDDDQFPHKAVYVGRTEDGDVALAVAVLGDRAAAYVCDGNSLEAWFRGSVDSDEVSLTSKTGDRIRAELDDDGRLGGTLRHDGKTREFELRAAKSPAGIYRAKGSSTTIGWIVLPNGDVVGVATDSAGNSSPAPTLPADRKAEVDGETVTATPVDGGSNV